MPEKYIFDSNRELWIFDGKRVYHKEAEEEFIGSGVPVSENGYSVSTYEGAISLLVKYGYISRKDKKKHLINVGDELKSHSNNSYDGYWKVIKMNRHYIYMVSVPECRPYKVARDWAHMNMYLK